MFKDLVGKKNLKKSKPFDTFFKSINTGVVIFTLPVMSFIGYSIFRPCWSN